MKFPAKLFVFLILYASGLLFGNESISVYYYKDLGALLFDLPQNRVILLDVDRDLFRYAFEKLENEDERQLKTFVQKLNGVATALNSGDLLQRREALFFLRSHLNSNGEEYEGNILYKQIEGNRFIELSSLFSTAKNRERRELIVGGIHALGELEERGVVEEITQAFREFDLSHSIFSKSDWFDYGLACYFAGKLTDAELCALAVLSTLVSYQQPEDVIGIEIIDLESKRGEEFFPEFYQGTLKCDPNWVYRTLLSRIKHRSRLEKLIFRMEFSKKPKMQDFNAFVLQGMCYFEDKYLLHLMPFTFHELLKIHFNDNVQELGACFGYSEDLEDWRGDQRPISVPCTRIPVMSVVHNQRISHLLETLVHDTAHQVICSYIPKDHRDAFRKVASYLDNQLKNGTYNPKLAAIRNYFYDMPFLYYTRDNIPPKLAFYISYVVAIYRTLSTNWKNSYIDEIIALALTQRDSNADQYSEETFFTECETYLEGPGLSEEMKSQLQGDKELVVFLKNALYEALQG